MGKSTNGNAVRIYTLNERATKFRNTAACLSWGEKTGSAEKKAYILGLLPAGATDTRSLGKDLTKKQQEELVAANKGQFPNRRRKVKRTLEAQAPMAIPTPGFQPGGRSVDDDAHVQSHQGSERSQLGVQVSQPTNLNTPMSFNDLSSLSHSSQVGAPQSMVGQDLNASLSAGANYNGHYNTYDNSSAANFLAPSQSYPSQAFLNNSGNLSSLSYPGDHIYPASTPGHMNNTDFCYPAQYSATYGGQTTGESFPTGGAGGYTSLQKQGDRLLNPPVSAPMQKRKRARTAPAEDEAESSHNRRAKRARTDTPGETPKESSSPEILAGGAESLLRLDENGFVITNPTHSTQTQDEVLYPADFDKFLDDSQYGEDDAEGEDVVETWDAPVSQDSNNTLPETPALLPAQGRKRKRSLSTEDGDEVSQGPKSKRLRTKEDVQTPEGSTTTGSEQSEAPARPVNVARGQKRGRGSSESRGDTETSVESPPAKRQRTTQSSDEAGTSSGADSTTTNDKSSDNDATCESSSDQSSDDSDGSEYTPLPYHQTSLKSIARPTTGGKGPYGADGRPVTGGKGKGKGPLKSSRRANMARKAPAKRE